MKRATFSYAHAKAKRKGSVFGLQCILTPDAMRAMEKAYIAQYAVTEDVLMERAAGALIDCVEEALPDIAGHTAIFAVGPGKNGGDGYAAARLYAQRIGHAIIVQPFDERALTGVALENCRRAHETQNVTFAGQGELEQLPRTRLIVDALFGIGLNRPLDTRAARLVERMEYDRAHATTVFAMDMPSGIDASTGRALGSHVRATYTVTFETLKTGHVFGDGLTCSGHVFVRSIGIPENMRPEDAPVCVQEKDVIKHLRIRPRDAHKGDFGHLLLIAGSEGMAGAACIAARAALRSGVGLVSVACPAPIVPIVQTLAPCAMCLPMAHENGRLSADALSSIEVALPGKTAIAIGPGCTRELPLSIVRLALESALPVALDADALNVLSENRALLAGLDARHLLTPHPGEAARLLGHAVVDPIEAARELARFGAIAQIKGTTSVICGRRTYLRTDGASGMAKGGSGDALTGLTGGLLAQGYETETAAWLGAAIHGLAGERAQRRLSAHAMTAMDLVDSFHQVFLDVERSC